MKLKICVLVVCVLTFFAYQAQAQSSAGIWIGASEIAALPTSGTSWNNVLSQANQSCGAPVLSDQDQNNNVCIMAKALAFARTGQSMYRNDVISAIWAVVNSGTYNGRALALGRELGAYAIAADLISLKTYDPALDTLFRTKIKALLTTPTISGPSNLIDCHESRPNNWGTHCGGSRAAVAAYLGDTAQLARVAQVFKGWLGDRASYAGFSYGDLSWQCNTSAPVGINPAGCMKSGHSIDGVLPDDQRRGGTFTWPPPKENYVYEGLQGALLQAVILYRAGYDPFDWQNQALRRAFQWLHTQASYPAAGDDTWMPHLINYYYVSTFPEPTPSSPGKNVGWTDWTHAGTVPAAPVLSVSTTSLSFTAVQGGVNPPAKSIQITNIGGGTLSWTASEAQSWLNLSAASGSAPATLSVSVSTGGLLAGTYTGTITVAAGTVQGSPKQISVTLTVSLPPQSVGTLTFTPNPLIGGNSTTGTVTVTSAAPAGGSSVALTSSNTMVGVPASVMVPASATSANFTATTSSVTLRQQATVSATLNGSVQAVVIVDPAPVSDTTAPTISSVAAVSLIASGATITWLTNEASDTQVDYGTTTAYGSVTPLNTTRVTSHSATISGLTAGTLYHYRVKSRDAAGNLATSGDFTFTTPPVTGGTACSTSTKAWQNTAFASRAGTFTAEFDATPNVAKMDGVTGLSLGPATGYSKLAVIARFNPFGMIDARNSGAYAAAGSIPYTPGLKYHFRLVIRVSAHTYDIYVTPPGQAEKLVGLNFAFRTEQAAVTSFSNLGHYAAIGTHTVCSFIVR